MGFWKNAWDQIFPGSRVKHTRDLINRARQNKQHSNPQLEILVKEIETQIYTGKIKIQIGKDTKSNQQLAWDLIKYCEKAKLKNVRMVTFDRAGRKEMPVYSQFPMPWCNLYIVAEV